VSDERTVLLEAAAKIADRLRREAMWSGNGCTWPIAQSGTTGSVMAGPELYRGAAGIGLALAELAGLIGDRSLAHAAKGSLHYATLEGRKLPYTSFGLYLGRVGLAYVLARIAHACQEQEYRDAALDVLGPTINMEYADRGLDVIGGAAGAIPALLCIDKWLDYGRAKESAIRLGNRILSAARKHPVGWSWPSYGPQSADLTGLGHGASGYGYSLLELYGATGHETFRYAALQAFAYERSRFDPDEQNWPDYRLMSRGSGPSHTTGSALPPPEAGSPGVGTSPQKAFMLAWCHGAAGIGLTRLRALQFLADEEIRFEAQVSVARTRKALERQKPASYCLCHGGFGNCELLLQAADRGAGLHQKAFVYGYIDDALDQVKKGHNHWPCGLVGIQQEPGLMLGDSGIVHFLTRAAAPERIESILLVTPELDSKTKASGSIDRQLPVELIDAKREHIRAFFGQTLAGLARMGIRGPGPGSLSEHPSTASSFHKWAEDIDPAADGRRGEFLADLLSCDAARFKLANVAQVEWARTSPFVGSIPWDHTVLGLAPSARLVETRYDWQEWVNDSQRCLTEPQRRHSAFLILRQQNGDVGIHRLDAWSRVVLASLSDRPQYIDLLNRIRNQLSTGGPTVSSRLEERLRQQLQAAYDAGAIEVALRTSLAF
jgi:hypothetical protein